jgi:hypothetical protein
VTGTYQWILKNKHGRNIHMSFYETGDPDQKYTLDGQPLNGNIVIIEVRNH